MQQPKGKVTQKEMFLALIQVGVPREQTDSKPTPYLWNLYKKAKAKEKGQREVQSIRALVPFTSSSEQ